ncbi:MAG TPA: SprB repeat-containing protein, partial [Verrucomicrobiae bacterium]|nr:SprB repeat-containing protein [Verrucomicrobiae bacterium]
GVGSYSVTVTDANGCTATGTWNITQPAQLTTSATSVNVNCYGDATGSIDLSVSGGTTPYKYDWLDVTGAENTQDRSGLAAGTYTVVVTDANGCTTQRSVTITQPPVINVSLQATPQLCVGASNGVITVTASGGTGTLMYSLNGGTYQSGNVFNNLAAGTYTVTVKDANNCTKQASVTIAAVYCNYCTYTQGAYGSEGGKSCIGETGPNNQLSTRDLIIRSLNYYGGTMRIGTATTYINIGVADVESVIKYLPGGGNSYTFTQNVKGKPAHVNGNISSMDFQNRYTRKSGKEYTIDNTLLAQTITLGLNLGINSNLSALQLKPGMYLNVLDPAGGCGSTTPVACSYDSYLPNQTVVNALSTKTVGGLYELANKALAGESLPAGVSLTMIAEVVDAINNFFDECKLFAGYSAMPMSCSSTTFSNENRSENITERIAVEKLQVIASPNPYTDNVRFTIESPVSGQGSLEVFNLVGQKVQTVYQGYLTAGAAQTVEYKVPVANRTTLIYVLTVGGQRVTGKLLNIK